MKIFGWFLLSAFFTSLVCADAGVIYKKCATCHGNQGEKKALGRSEVIQGWPGAKVEEALRAYKNGKRNVHGMGALMKGQVLSMSDADIKAVADYISKLK